MIRRAGRAALSAAALFVAVLCVAAGPPTAESASSFQLLTVDGLHIGTQTFSIAPDGALSLDAGATDAPKLDDLLTLSPPPASQPAAPPAGAALLFLADGGRLHGRIVAAAERGIRVDFAIAPAQTVAFEALAAIRVATSPNARADAELAERLDRRDDKHDVAIVLGADGPTALPGVLEALSATEWDFRVGQRRRRGPIDRLYAVVLAAATSAPRPALRVHLRSGDDFGARLLSADAAAVQLTTPFAAALRLDWSAVERLEFRSPRVEFLSDLKPVRVESRGTFGHPWPWRADAGLFGGPLRIGERLFAKGLATHAYSRLTYDLNEPFQRFDAVVGLDAADAPAGCAIFRVLVDDKPAFDSGPIRAADPPRDLSVPLAGARRLAIVLDFGPDLDLGDRGVWGQARLVR